MKFNPIRYAEPNRSTNERFLMQTRPHWITLVTSALWVIVGVAAYRWALNDTTIASILQTNLFERVTNQPSLVALVPLAILIFMGIWRLAVNLAALIGSELTITTQRVIVKTGIFWRTAREIDARKLEGSELIDQSWLGQWLDYGTIQVHGISGHPLILRTAIRPLEARKQIARLIAHYDQVARSNAKPGTARTAK